MQTGVEEKWLVPAGIISSLIADPAITFGDGLPATSRVGLWRE